MRYYDAHAHLADPRVLANLPLVISEAHSHGVRGILANSARACEWPTVMEMANSSPVLGALGLHPFFLDEWRDDLPSRLEQSLRAHERLRAVGEIGLDFYTGRDDMPRQEAAFSAQLDVAVRLAMPGIFHNRKSWGEFFAILRSAGPVRGVCHHFSGSIETARQALDAGLYLSFCGPLTYTNARRLKEAARYVPLGRILTETDTPDLPPVKYRGSQSRPHHVCDVLAEIAHLKGLSEEEVAGHVEANFIQLFGEP